VTLKIAESPSFLRWKNQERNPSASERAKVKRSTLEFFRSTARGFAVDLVNGKPAGTKTDKEFRSHTGLSLAEPQNATRLSLQTLPPARATTKGSAYEPSARRFEGSAEALQAV